MVSDLERFDCVSIRLRWLRFSDIYGEDMMPAAWCSCAAIPTTMALHWSAARPRRPRGARTAPPAFEVGSLDEVFRRAPAFARARRDHPVRRAPRAGVQIAIEFLDPDGHNLEIYWNIDQIGPMAIAAQP